MNFANKQFKIKIQGSTFSLSLDDSYIAKNVYKTDKYNPEIEGAHYHPIYEAFIIGGNAITFFSEGKKSEYKNGVLIVPPFIKHYAERLSDYRIMFSLKSAENLPNSLTFVPASKDIYMYAEKIEQNLLKKENLADEKAEALLKLIFCEIATTFLKKDKAYSTAKASYFEKIEKMLFDFHLDITLADVANELGLSKKQTSRIIKKNYNSSFAEMLRERRLDSAASLLINTNMTIAEIVERVNFPSESYFYNQFKKIYSKTPLEYRKSAIKNRI